MAKRPLEVRVEAGRDLGMGHFMRSLALAEMWKEQDSGPVTFVTAQMPTHARQRLAEVDIPVTHPNMVESAPENCVRIIDGRQFSDQEVSTWCEAADLSVVIDDHAARPDYPSDIVVNPNLMAEAGLYKRKLRSDAVALCGPAYALLRGEIRTLVGRVPPRKSKNRRVLVVLGGSDPSGSTGRICRYLLEQDRWTLQVTATLGPAAGLPPEENFTPEMLERLRLRRQPPDLPALMAASDLAISAAGTTLLEMAALGLPGLWLSNNDGEVEAAQQAEERGFGLYLGPVETVGAEDIAAALRRVLVSSDAWQSMSLAGESITDGRGAYRVWSRIESLAASKKRQAA